MKEPGAEKPQLMVYRMDGYIVPEGRGRLKCGDFWCKLKHGQTNVSGADLAVFSELDVQRFVHPPNKRPSDVWAFFSKEPQLRLKIKKNLPEWDGVFNFSATFNRNNEANTHIFRAELEKIIPHKSIKFFPMPRMKPLRALWFVSHCSSKNNSRNIYSGREQYVLELSKHIPIDIYSASEEPFCRQVFGDLVKEHGTPEPDMSDYMFYLSFENSLCRDYVTEKLWKVLESNSTTIPIALGGTSIEDYEIVAPPSSFMHVKNFTSPAALAEHLRYVAENDEAFHYYNQWRNEFTLVSYLTRGHGGDYLNLMLSLA
ncbi:glycoprotein 3-alpha-L-fucosyltransferase A-like [Watersipora subatra]|uniref:glycoprotein 3-alpha-L-fucosyltransferase A-like n=1 Tax=Watersipora subatra TaxID=2589382 RepID=UPI00355AF92D